MCVSLLPENLNPGPCPSHFTCIYTWCAVVVIVVLIDIGNWNIRGLMMNNLLELLLRGLVEKHMLLMLF